MSTQVKAEVIPSTSAKVIAAIVASINADASAQAARVTLSDVIKSEAARLGYTREQAQLMTKLSMRSARGFKSDDKAEIAAFDLKYASRVSTVMSLAYPATEAAANDVAKAIAINGKASAKSERIGENKLIEIARGKITLDEVLAGKTVTRENKKSTLTPTERLGTAFAGLFSSYDVGKAGGLTFKEVREIFANALKLREGKINEAAK